MYYDSITHCNCMHMYIGISVCIYFINIITNTDASRIIIAIRMYVANNHIIINIDIIRITMYNYRCNVMCMYVVHCIIIAMVK